MTKKTALHIISSAREARSYSMGLSSAIVKKLNRVFAFSKVYGNENAIVEVNKLDVTADTYYHAMPGHLYIGIDNSKAVEHYKRVIALSGSSIEKQVLLNVMGRIG